MFINNYARRILLVLVKIVKSRLDVILHDMTQTGFSNRFPAIMKILGHGYVSKLFHTPKYFETTIRVIRLKLRFIFERL